MNNYVPAAGAGMNGSICRLVRWHKICKLIASGTYPSAERIAQELEVKPKTIYRDLDVLRDFFDQEIYYSAKDFGWYYLTPPDHLLKLGKRLTKDYKLQAGIAGRHPPRLRTEED